MLYKTLKPTWTHTRDCSSFTRLCRTQDHGVWSVYVTHSTCTLASKATLFYRHFIPGYHQLPTSPVFMIVKVSRVLVEFSMTQVLKLTWKGSGWVKTRQSPSRCCRLQNLGDFKNRDFPQHKLVKNRYFPTEDHVKFTNFTARS